MELIWGHVLYAGASEEFIPSGTAPFPFPCGILKG
jgi:hypothetical protein